jgi:hypothetical protein
MVLLWCANMLFHPRRFRQPADGISTLFNERLSPSTLIVYVMANTDESTEDNFRYFVRHGVKSGSLSHNYIFVIQVGDGLVEFRNPLPLLPENAAYVNHTNECYDVGTVGWLIYESGNVRVSDFEYFIWLNPSVRGPIMPSWQNQMDWPSIFTSKVDEDTKLSGTVISCGGILDPTLPPRINPHLQSYVLATDKTGLAILHDAGALSCYASYTEVVYHGELGASLAILSAGYNIHSTMLRYQGVDWRNKSNWGCNRGGSPIAPGNHFGADLDPLEVVFVKLKDKQLSWETSRRAVAYTSMIEGDAKRCLQCNLAVDDSESLQRARNAISALAPFFNESYYVLKSRDLHALHGMDLWKHFLMNGFNEQRPFALTVNGKQKEFPSGVPNLEVPLQAIVREWSWAMSLNHARLP